MGPAPLPRRPVRTTSRKPEPEEKNTRWFDVWQSAPRLRYSCILTYRLNSVTVGADGTSLKDIGVAGMHPPIFANDFLKSTCSCDRSQHGNGSSRASTGDLCAKELVFAAMLQLS